MIHFPIVSEIDIALYVMANTPSWMPISKDPIKGGPAIEVNIQRLLGDQLIIEEFTQILKKGFSYSYPFDTNVQGLTKVTDCPYLFGTMAPDQYILAEPIKLIDIENLDALFEDKSQFERLKNLTCNALDDEFYQQLKIAVPDLSREIEKKLAKKIQATIGSEHIRAISQYLKHPYNVITITEDLLSEAAGYNIPDNVNVFTVSEQSAETVEAIIDDKKAHIERIKIYKGHHECLLEQMLIQSDRAIGEDKRFVLRLALADLDMPRLIGFFDRTIGKGFPLVIHCTDGIDRAGILEVAFTMLYQYTQNDFTQLGVSEQRQFLINLIEHLRIDRGPYFLRQEADIARAIMLGYTLIATKKALIKTWEKAKEIALTKDVDFDKAMEIAEKDMEVLDLVDKRKSLSRDFALINANHKKDKKDKESEDAYIHQMVVKMVNKKSRNDLPYYIEKAPIEIYNNLISKKLAISSYQKDGKNIYHFAVNTYLENPVEKNRNGIKDLLIFGKKFAIESMSEELDEHIRKWEVHHSKKQIKEEIGTQTFDLKTNLRMFKSKARKIEPKNKAVAILMLISDLKKALSSSADSKSKKPVKTLSSLINSNNDGVLLTSSEKRLTNNFNSNSSSFSSDLSSDSFFVSRSCKDFTMYEKSEKKAEKGLPKTIKRSSSLEENSTKENVKHNKKDKKDSKDKNKRKSFGGFNLGSHEKSKLNSNRGSNVFGTSKQTLSRSKPIKLVNNNDSDDLDKLSSSLNSLLITTPETSLLNSQGPIDSFPSIIFSTTLSESKLCNEPSNEVILENNDENNKNRTNENTL
jgi:hypothetical protein